MVDVGAHFTGFQRDQVKARDDSLGKLAQFGLPELFQKLGLPKQNNLQQLRLVGLEIGEQTQLLEHLDVEVLRLVDHHHRAPPPRMDIEKVMMQCIGQNLGGRTLPDLDAELLADRLEQLFGPQRRGQYQGKVHVVGNTPEQAAAYGCLPGADLAGQQDKPTFFLQSVSQVRERFAVLVGQVQVTRIGRDRKRTGREVEVLFVHGSAQWISPGDRLDGSQPSSRGTILRLMIFLLTVRPCSAPTRSSTAPPSR